jgi:hypothetical protein
MVEDGIKTRSRLRRILQDNIKETLLEIGKAVVRHGGGFAMANDQRSIA